jgi:hypothetical protein
MTPFAGACLLCLPCFAPLPPPPDVPETGVYACKYTGPGRRVARNDGGGTAVLGKRFGAAFGKGTLRSVANDNSLFVLDLKGVGALPKEAEPLSLALVIDGVCLVPFSRSDRQRNGTIDLSCHVQGEQAARKVAARLKVEPQLRRHPGHRFQVRWSPEKAEYRVGEAVTLKLEVRNTGKVPFSFWVGGQQRGARDNQFRFLAYASWGGGKAVPDTGDPEHFGGKAYLKTLAPGETFTKTVALDGWFKFTKADTYRVTGMYQFAVQTAPDGWQTAWDDVAVGDCLVKVVAKR